MEPQENNPPESEDTPETPPQRWAGLGVRVASAIVLGAIAFICIWRGGLAFTAFVLLAALVMKKEWDALITRQSIILRAGGYIYVILPCASLLWLRGLENGLGLGATVSLVAVVCATDIGAYIVGKRFGRHKLSPTISPGKTWEGLLGGIVAALLAALVMSSYVTVPHSFISAVWIGPFLAIIAQAGDLFESAVKRNAGVKDSGSLLPGHGGLLDRFDGYMFAIPVFALIIHSALQYAPAAVQ